jgi:hypothetical protein
MGLVIHRDAQNVMRSKIPQGVANRMIVELDVEVRQAKDPNKKVFALKEDTVLNLNGMKYFMWKDEYLVFE